LAVRIAWTPWPGNQVLAFQCPVYEQLLHGPRGGGKTILGIMKFAKQVGKGYGSKWRGIVFRRSYKELGDVIQKTKEAFSQIWRPDQAWYNSSDHYWQWRTGEQLLLRHFERESDYYDYHGHEYQWYMWEELTNWPDPAGYKRMLSCLRSKHAEIRALIQCISTCNPYGPGHGWVKKRWRISGRGLDWYVIKDAKNEKGEIERPRVAIPLFYSENSALNSDGGLYLQSIQGAAKNAAELEAWLSGNWDILAGGMFADCWDERYNIVEPFEVPDDWDWHMAHDWGSSKPFANGWYVRSNGSDFVRRGVKGFKRYSSVPGDVFRMREWYGTRGGDNMNEGVRLISTLVAKGVIEREHGWGLAEKYIARIADSQIAADHKGQGTSIQSDMEQDVRLDSGLVVPGLTFSLCKKGPRVREVGWEIMRNRMQAAHPPAHNGPRESPGLFVIAGQNPHYVRTVPTAVRNERQNKLDDIDSETEDHICDENRYLMYELDSHIKQGRTYGMG
jgi:hypothetical protein